MAQAFFFRRAPGIPNRAVLFAQGDRIRELFVIAKGMVKLPCCLPGGETTLLGPRYRGQLLEECAYGFDPAYPVTATTIVPCQIHPLHAARVRDAERESMSSTLFLNDVLKRDLYNIRAANVEMKTLPPQERVRRLLAEIARGQGAQPSNGLVEFALPLSNSEMAEWLGISGTQYKRTRSALEQSGQLLQKAGRRVAIRERE